jgi:pimeloyl-ACP methyl ester carboxylesterase
MRIVAFALVAFAAASDIAAQSLFEGTWQSPSSPGWTFSLTEIVRGMGTALRARVSGCPASPPGRVSELRTNNDVVTFKCTSADGSTTIAFTGRRRGETIAFTSTVEKQSGEIAPGVITAAPSLFPGTFTVTRTGDAQVVANPKGPRLLEFAAAVNRPDLDLKGEAVIAIADNINELRGVLIVVAWGMGFGVYDDDQWQQLAADLQFGVVRMAVRHISQPNASSIGPGRIPDTADQVLVMLLRELGEQSQHPELATAPFVLWGHSAGGGLISRLAARLPQRTVGVVRYHNNGAATGNLQILRQLPTLILVGGNDPGNRGAAETDWLAARAGGAPWTFGVEPEATHENAADLERAHPLFRAWLTSVVQQRIVGKGQPLRPVENSGWLANIQTGEVAQASGYRGDRNAAIWLPDETTVGEWKTVIAPK